MLRKPDHLIFYLSTLHKPAAVAGLCNVLKHKVDTFSLKFDTETRPRSLTTINTSRAVFPVFKYNIKDLPLT